MNYRSIHVVGSIVLLFMFDLCELRSAFSKAETMHVGNERKFFVATTGKDTNPGTEKLPFATPQRARDALRKIKATEGLRQPVTVFVRGGKYFFKETFQLKEEDSGTSISEITYKAYPGEKPIFSGGRRLSKPKPWQGKIVKYDVPFVQGSEFIYRQLFINGKRQIRARYPNFDPSNPLYGGWANVEKPVAKDNFSEFHYKPGQFPRKWAKPWQGEVNCFPGNNWLNDIIPIKSIDEERRIISLTHMTRNAELAMPGIHREVMTPPIASWFSDAMDCAFNKGVRYIVENMREEIDQPGEWSVDMEEGIVYFWPPDSLKVAEVVFPYLDSLINLEKTAYVTISGFTLTETNAGDNFHHASGEGYGPQFPMKGQKYAGDAIHLIDARACTIERNTFDQVGGNGVYLEGYNWRNNIRRNTITGAGACGIALVGNKEQHPVFNYVEDNDISHTGWFNKYSAGIYLGTNEASFVRHNRIQHVPHHAINLGSNGFGRNFVEYNEIRYAAEEIHDSGAINMWMEGDRNEMARDVERSGHVIRYNFIADSPANTPEFRKFLEQEWQYTWTCGIYLDNISSNCFIYGNIIVRAPDVGIVVGGGKNNVIENNILVDNGWAFGFQDYAKPFGVSYMTNHVYARNIVYVTQPKNLAFRVSAYTDRVIAESDYNLFYPFKENELAIGYDKGKSGPFEAISDWRKDGYDIHSVMADPLFVDPNHDDYRLRPESPAFGLGFQPIDVSRIGIRKEP